MSSETTFTVHKNDILLKERIPFCPLLLGYKWENHQQKLEVDFLPSDENKVLEVMLYEEKISQDLFIFSPATSMNLNGTNSIIVKIQNGKGSINLGKGAKRISQQQTTRNFVLVFVIDGCLRKVTQPFHARSKWALSQDENNTEALIERLQSLRDDIHNIPLIRNIETVKSEWRKQKDVLRCEESPNRKTWEQKIAVCTWLQTKIVNDMEPLTIDELFTRTQQKYLKEGKTERKSLDTTKEIIHFIRKNCAGVSSPSFQEIEIDPTGITFGPFAAARTSDRKRARAKFSHLKAEPPTKKRSVLNRVPLPSEIEPPNEPLSDALFEEFKIDPNLAWISDLFDTQLPSEAFALDSVKTSSPPLSYSDLHETL